MARRTRATSPETPDLKFTPPEVEAPGGSAFQRCLGDLEDFAQKYWGREPLHRSTGDSFADVFSIDAVDELITSTTPRRPELRLVREGKTLDSAVYASAIRLGGRQVDDAIDPEKVIDAIAEGATLVLQSLHRTCAPVGQFAAALEAEMSHPVQVNAYLTPAGSRGLSTHADGHDVLVVQLHGEKRWEVDGLGEFTAVPGDTIYIPAQTQHQAWTESGSSLHLTVGILRVTYRAAVDRVLRAKVPRLDDPLPLGYTHVGTSLDHGFEGALQEAGAALLEADPLEMGRQEVSRRRPRLLARRRLASLIGLGHLRLEDRVQLRPGVSAALQAEDEGRGRVRLTTSDRLLTPPLAAEPALERLLSGSPVAVGELPGIDPESQLVLVRRLVTEGLLILDR